MKLIIVGGGASGLMLASILKTKNANIEIEIVEKLEHVGKKILATGNGRCNLSNASIKENCYNNSFGFEIASNFDVNKYFNNLGLLTYSDDEGRIYPLSNTANSVLDVLRESISGVKVHTSTNIIRIIKENDKYVLTDENNKKYEADIIAFATGGKTYYKENNSYMIASMLSHKIKPLRPTLTPIKVKENLSSIENLRAKVNASLYCDNKLIYKDSGEVLFKKDNLSGIVMFQLSSYIAKNPYKKYQIVLDLLPSFSKDEIESYLNNHSSMVGLFPKMINQYLKKISNNDNKTIASNIKELTFNVIDNIDFKSAQVTSGGISIDELKDSLESKYHDNLYFLGEVIDVDGICGGYNLHFAFSCANVVANDIINKVGENNE